MQRNKAKITKHEQKTRRSAVPKLELEIRENKIQEQNAGKKKTQKNKPITITSLLSLIVVDYAIPCSN